MDMTRSLLLAAFAVVLPACAIESPVFGEPDLDVGAAETSSTTTAGAGGAGGAPATSTGSGTTASGAASTVSASSVTATASSAASTSSGGVVTCGNGVIDPGEECDDLGVLPGDGCGPTCILEGSPNLCPSGATMKVNGPVVIAGTTVGKQNITKTSCGGTSAPDVVYQVIPSKSGPLTVQLETLHRHRLQRRADLRRQRHDALAHRQRAAGDLVPRRDLGPQRLDGHLHAASDALRLAASPPSEAHGRRRVATWDDPGIR
jgi:cysteine-rich repeat protein